ncbi:hypothetical protein HPB48_019312 [Haemaphysalis longicornis]|uniref:Rad21/Rec8-like protein C-terminal eukaryotic domain-containing protein n=1 Tax=Haemaphysalis longicornis TaxID=44386 RepID=A0A9J6FEN3_HAELO|nr:hypothetical protein HPB48_019312 [Haemaphysalis longicornis]
MWKREATPQRSTVCPGVGAGAPVPTSVGVGVSGCPLSATHMGGSPEKYCKETLADSEHSTLAKEKERQTCTTVRCTPFYRGLPLPDNLCLLQIVKMLFRVFTTSVWKGGHREWFYTQTSPSAQPEEPSGGRLGSLWNRLQEVKDAHGMCTLEALVPPDAFNRRSVAASFATLLRMHKRGMVQLEQFSAYGPVVVTVSEEEEQGTPPVERPHP